jgi:hypothetical protein
VGVPHLGVSGKGDLIFVYLRQQTFVSDED